MIEVTAKSLWPGLLDCLLTGSPMPKVDAGEFCRRCGISSDEFAVAFDHLLAVGAVVPLDHEELTAIAAGDMTPSDVLRLGMGGDDQFLRIVHPGALQIRLAAQFALLRDRIAAEGQVVGPTESMVAATEMGISPEQLTEAKAHPLPEERWRIMRNMPGESFPRTWRRLEAKGDTQGMKHLMAALARLHEMQSKTDAERQCETVAAILRFVESVDRSMTRSTADWSPTGREPIAQAVRHEVWRRDQGRCVQCGGRERLEFDHIIPVSRGGANTARNLQLLCEECNRKKSDSV